MDEEELARLGALCTEPWRFALVAEVRRLQAMLEHFEYLDAAQERGGDT